MHISPQQLEEVRLAKEAMAGSRKDFEALVRLTARAVHAELVVLTGDKAQSEDLTQETYLRAWRNISGLAEAGKFRPWLYAIARTAALDAHRLSHRKKRGAPPAPLEETPSPTTSPDRTAEARETQQRAVAALGQLPAPHRQALTLRFLHQADYAQISRDLGVTNGALRGLLTRGLAMLRETLNDGSPT